MICKPLGPLRIGILQMSAPFKNTLDEVGCLCSWDSLNQMSEEIVQTTLPSSGKL